MNTLREYETTEPCAASRRREAARSSGARSQSTNASASARVRLRSWARSSGDIAGIDPSRLEMVQLIAARGLRLEPSRDVQRSKKRLAAGRRPPAEECEEVFGPVDVQSGILGEDHRRHDAGIARGAAMPLEAARSEARADRIDRA